MSNNKQLAYLKLITTMILWAGVYHAATFVVKELDPFTSSAVRWSIASVILCFFLYRKENSFKRFKQPIRHWPTIIAIGFFAIYAYNILFFTAEGLLPGNLVAIIICFTPCITVILSAIFFKEKINALTFLGILLAFLGAIFAINSSDSGCGRLWCNDVIQTISYGEIISFLLCVGTAVYTLLLKKSAKYGMDGLTITTLSSTVAAIMLIITAIFKGNLLSIFSLSLSGWGYMLYIAIFGSALGYKWYSDSVKVVKIGQAVIFTNTIPIGSIIIGLLFFNINVTYLFFIAAILVILGVLVTNYSLQKR